MAYEFPNSTACPSCGSMVPLDALTAERDRLRGELEIERGGSMALLEAARSADARHEKSRHAAEELRAELESLALTEAREREKALAAVRLELKLSEDRTEAQIDDKHRITWEYEDKVQALTAALSAERARIGEVEAALTAERDSLRAAVDAAVKAIKETNETPIAQAMAEWHELVARKVNENAVLVRDLATALAANAQMRDDIEALTATDADGAPSYLVEQMASALFRKTYVEESGSLAPNAGSALLAEVAALRAVEKAAREVQRITRLGASVLHIIAGGYEGAGTHVHDCPGCQLDAALAALDALRAREGK